jgi:hypothetical protein
MRERNTRELRPSFCGLSNIMKYLEDSHNYRELADQIFYACPTAGRDGGLARDIGAQSSEAHRVGAANKTNQQLM